MNRMLLVLEKGRKARDPGLKTKQSLPRQDCIAVKKKKEKKKGVQESEHEDQYQISFSNVSTGLERWLSN